MTSISPLSHAANRSGIACQFPEKRAEILVRGETLERAVDDQGAVQAGTVGQRRQLPAIHGCRLRPGEKTDIRSGRRGEADQPSGPLGKTCFGQYLRIDPDLPPEQIRNGRIRKEATQVARSQCGFPFLHRSSINPFPPAAPPPVTTANGWQGELIDYHSV